MKLYKSKNIDNIFYSHNFYIPTNDQETRKRAVHGANFTETSFTAYDKSSRGDSKLFSECLNVLIASAANRLDTEEKFLVFWIVYFGSGHSESGPLRQKSQVCRVLTSGLRVEKFKQEQQI